MNGVNLFVSSVQKELAAERRAIRDFVEGDALLGRFFNVFLFEDLPASDRRADSVYSDRLEIWNPGELPPPLTMEKLRVPHPSIPRNPLIADPLFLARYIEKAGTGTLDMIARLCEVGLPEPEFRQDGGIFVQKLRRPKPATVFVPGTESRSESGSEWWRTRSEWRPEWRPESVHDRIMVAIAASPASRSEIATAIGHKSITRALRQALSDLMAVGLVAYTIPEKPNSRLQRYRAVTSPKNANE